MKIAYHALFLRQLKKLPKDLQEEVFQKVLLFGKDIKHPSLKVHKLQGHLKDLFSFSVNYSYRIVFKKIKDEAVLLEVGTHDIYK